MDTIFDYSGLAGESGISPDRLRELESCIREQYGPDEMMVELRLLRTLRAIRDGAVTLDKAIAEFSGCSQASPPRAEPA